MTAGRKILIAAGALCILTMAGALVAAAFLVDAALGCLMLALVAWWLGKPIMDVLGDRRYKE